MTIRDVTTQLEELAPPSYQESYDNSGLLVGNASSPVKGILVTLDCTEAVIDEAIAKDCNLVIAHHPIVFKGLKRLTGRNYIERTVIKAIKNDVAIYACHTNLDKVRGGVNGKIADRLGLVKTRILSPERELLRKLVFFVPSRDVQMVTSAVYEAGAGRIGNYSNCSFQTTGKGTFRPEGDANPTIGHVGSDESVEETRVEVLLPSHLESKVLAALRSAHPYEEVAYFLHAIENENQDVGSGMIGELPREMDPNEFLGHLKEKMSLSVIRYTPLNKEKISRVAVCGGSGSFLLANALQADADAFVTSDYKYHDFFDAESRLMICDIGHYESEVFTKELIGNYLSEKFGNFALHLSEVTSNPIKYFV
jgi:dinuclear metal center YbgI/SA1388 family protein